MKRLLFSIACIVPLFLGSASAGQFKLSAPPLVGEQALICDIAIWDGSVVVVTEEYTAPARPVKRTFHCLDREKESIGPLKLKDGYAVVALAENESFSFALCSRGKDLALFRKQRDPGARWEIIDLESKIDVRFGAKLAANKNMVFIVTPGELWSAREGFRKWRRLAMKGLLKDELHQTWLCTIGYPPMPSAILVTDDTFFWGYDVGEWGGAAYAAALRKTGVSRSVFKLTEGNVKGFCKDIQGNVWIACGLAHMGVQTARLVRYSQGKSEILVDQLSYERAPTQSNNKLKEPFPPLAIDGLTIGSREWPVVIGSGFGDDLDSRGEVLEFLDGRMQSLVSANFVVCLPDKDNRSIGCNAPVGVAILADDIYVALRGMGVLKFTEGGRGREYRQFIFRN